MKIYSIYDDKAVRYGNPFYEHNGVTATRAFKMEVNRPDSNNVIYRNPEDFTLMDIGEWIPETGEIKSYKPIKIATAISLQKDE